MRVSLTHSWSVSVTPTAAGSLAPTLVPGPIHHQPLLGQTEKGGRAVDHHSAGDCARKDQYSYARPTADPADDTPLTLSGLSGRERQRRRLLALRYRIRRDTILRPVADVMFDLRLRHRVHLSMGQKLRAAGRTGEAMIAATGHDPPAVDSLNRRPCLATRIRHRPSRYPAPSQLATTRSKQ